MLTSDKAIIRVSPLLIVIGRISLASIFVLGGLNKLLNYTVTLQRMHAVDLAFAALLLPIVIGLEIGCGVLIALGRWMVPIAALALAGFTLATNLVFHDFWTLDGKQAALQLSLFFKNISIAGALILLAGISVKT